MEKLFNFIDTNVVSALGWTLVHSVWQIIAISLIYAIIIRFEKRSPIRYRIGISLMFSQLLFSFITFNFVFQTSTLLQQSTVAKQYFSKIIIQITADNQMNFLEGILFYLESNLNSLVVFWVIGISVLVIRLIFNYFYVTHLKTSGISKVENSVAELFDSILQKIQIEKTVQLFQSSKVSVPVVIGFLKPIVLLPVGLVTNLSPKQIEAILAHEIAHIKRNDFIINVLQNFVEIVFFFHPALWWMSSKIREERENSCDDFAIELIGEKIHLVKALANVESFRQNPVLAMAFGKKRFTVLERVQRILGIENSTNKTHESLFFITVFAGILAGYLVFQSNRVAAQTQPPKPPKVPSIKTSSQKLVIDGVIVSNDSLVNDKSVMQFSNGKTRVIVRENGEIFINGKKHLLPEEEQVKVKKHIDELVRLESKMKPYGIEMEKLGDEMSKYSASMNVPSAEMEEISKNINSQSKRMVEFSRQQEKLMKQMSQLQEGSKQFKELEKQLESSEKQFEKLQKEMSMYDMQMEKFEKEMEKHHAPMDSIGGLMSKFEKPMEEIGKEMEVHSRAILLVLPYQVRKDIENGMNFTPPPPPPPRPSKVSKASDISKTPPPPPPAPKDRVSKPSKVNAPNPPSKINE